MFKFLLYGIDSYHSLYSGIISRNLYFSSLPSSNFSVVYFKTISVLFLGSVSGSSKKLNIASYLGLNVSASSFGNDFKCLIYLLDNLCDKEA